jgi:hypothetical protein
MPIPLPIIADTYRTALKWIDNSGQHAVNVMHFRVSAYTPALLFADIDTTVTANMWGSVATTASVLEVDITPLDGVSSTQTFPTGQPAKWTGSSGGTQYTPQAASLIKLQTGVRGRDNRGRLFLPFTSEAQQVDGFLISGTVTSITLAWQALVDAFAGGVVVAAYDRRHNGAGAHATPVTVATCEAAIGSQRKRQQRNR